MPRFKFEDQQVELIKDSLKANFERECIVSYSILCNALDSSEIFDIPEITAFDCNICLDQKKAAIAKHERLRDIYQAKVALFEAEHKFSKALTVQEQAYITENKGKCAIEETIINNINDKFALLVELKKLIAYLDEKTAPKPPKEPHPLADYEGWGGRLSDPTKTLQD